MRVVGLDELRAIATPDLVLAVVAEALLAHAEGRTTTAPPIHLTFPEAHADGHVKAGHVRGSERFAVKLATGFPRNRELGLPSNDGLVLVASARTGRPLAVLDDAGWLTAWRTAACAALATAALARRGPLVLGIIGTGLQARLARAWLAAVRPVRHTLVSGRRHAAAAALADELEAEAVPIGELLDRADVVVTATAATAPLFEAGHVRRGTHLTALGADMPGKQELPPDLFGQAAIVATDDVGQSLDHGDLGHAVRAGHVNAAVAVALGTILHRPPARNTDDITIADLTGVGVVDAALADAVTAIALQDRSTPRPAATTPPLNG